VSGVWSMWVSGVWSMWVSEYLASLTECLAGSLTVSIGRHPSVS
jgi:hypothetical protein